MPTTRLKRSSVEKKLRDFPSFVRPQTANSTVQFTKQASQPLTDAGLALKRLGLTERDVKGVPEVTSRVKEALGSVKEAIELLRGDDSKDSLRFIEKWDSLSTRDQNNVILEHVIVAAKLTTRRFMELLAGAQFDHSSTVSKIFVARSQLRVLEATVKAATDQIPITVIDRETGESSVVGHTNGDVKAMEIFHKITGALPTPKGSSFILNQQINAQSADVDPKPKNQTPLESMDKFLLDIEDVRKPKQLTSGAITAPVIPVEMPEGVPEIEFLSVEE
jgi:hypothetical protein